MTVCIFVGPTLPGAEVAAALDCECLPPARQGDVRRAAARRPRAIGIVDGYFHGVPSVWHKEILWAMAEGIHVFGAASMGALRAAELHRFGMRGVGRIFEHYRDGVLEDDDEVAVLHGPAETGFAPLTEPMVNVRATVERAEADGVLEADEGRALLEAAKATFYQERTWDALLDAAGATGVASVARERLAAWLGAGRVDRKRADALEMLAAMDAFLGGDPPPPEADYHFEWTHLWDSVASAAPGEDAAVLDELRLAPQAYGRTRRAALLRRLAARDAERARRGPDAAALRERHNAFRAERGLFSQRSLERWLGDSGLDGAGLERLLGEEVHLDALLDEHGTALDAHLVAELRMRDEYPALAERARDKRDRLEARGLAAAGPGDVDVTPIGLLAWYFEGRLQDEIPEDLDAYVRAQGLGGRDALYRILAREFLYSADNE